VGSQELMVHQALTELTELMVHQALTELTEQ